MPLSVAKTCLTFMLSKCFLARDMGVYPIVRRVYYVYFFISFSTLWLVLALTLIPFGFCFFGFLAFGWLLVSVAFGFSLLWLLGFGHWWLAWLFAIDGFRLLFVFGAVLQWILGGFGVSC